MRFNCPNCSAQFRVDDELIPDFGRKFKCGSCNHKFFVRRTVEVLPYSEYERAVAALKQGVAQVRAESDGLEGTMVFDPSATMSGFVPKPPPRPRLDHCSCCGAALAKGEEQCSVCHAWVAPVRCVSCGEYQGGLLTCEKCGARFEDFVKTPETAQGPRIPDVVPERLKMTLKGLLKDGETVDLVLASRDRVPFVAIKLGYENRPIHLALTSARLLIFSDSRKNPYFESYELAEIGQAEERPSIGAYQLNFITTGGTRRSIGFDGYPKKELETIVARVGRNG